MASIKKNFGYNLILTVCGYLFPLITFPYVSRVLGVENMGVCGFVDSIINYFILFAQLGIGSYGVREISRCRTDRIKRDQVFNNLFFLYLITTSIAICILVACTYYLEVFAPYKPFLLIGVLKLLFTLFLTEWFFQGIEEFKYITLRSILVRSLYVISVFVFVHSSDDVIVYYSLTAVTIVVNAIFNWTYSRRFRTLNFRGLTPSLYILPILSFGYYRILTSMYTTFNVTFLGFVKNDIEVGYFTTATKLYTIILSVFSAFTTVMIPRVSYMLEQGQKEELRQIANKITSLLVTFSVPVILFCIFNGEAIILLIAGAGYEGAILPFRIVIFLLFIIGMEQVVIQQFLMASASNRSILSVSTTGAVVGIALNILLTPILGAVGSAIAWGVSEASVLCVGLLLLSRVLGITLNWWELTKDVAWSVTYIISLVLIRLCELSIWYNMMATTITIATMFIVVNFYVHKNDTLITSLKSISKKK